MRKVKRKLYPRYVNYIIHNLEIKKIYIKVLENKINTFYNFNDAKNELLTLEKKKLSLYRTKIINLKQKNL